MDHHVRDEFAHDEQRVVAKLASAIDRAEPRLQRVACGRRGAYDVSEVNAHRLHNSQYPHRCRPNRRLGLGETELSTLVRSVQKGIWDRRRLGARRRAAGDRRWIERRCMLQSAGGCCGGRVQVARFPPKHLDHIAPLADSWSGPTPAPLAAVVTGSGKVG